MLACRAPQHLAALTALTIAGALMLPVAAEAKPKQKLYAISVSANVSTDLTTAVPGMDSAYGTPPQGCTDNTTTTYHWAAAARISAKTKPSPLLGHSASDAYFYVNTVLSSLNTSVYDEVDGSWGVEPAEPFSPPPDPSMCSFTPFRVTAPCAFTGGQATLRTPLFLVRDGATFSIMHLDGVDGPIVQCKTHQTATGSAPGAAGEGGYLLEGNATTLRVGTVLALRNGRAVSASGTSSLAERWFDGHIDGNETFKYRLTVKRVH